MTYDQWKTRDPNDTGFYDMPEDDGPTELDLVYAEIERLRAALTEINSQAVCAIMATETECFDMLQNCAEISDRALALSSAQGKSE